MARWGFALLALVAFAACASAARAPFLQDRLEVQEGQSNFGAFWKDVMRRGRGKELLEDKPAYAMIRFMVPPSLALKFEDAWLKCHKEAMKIEKGLDYYVLHRDLNDNSVFYLYGEWQLLDDFFEHLSSDHFNDFTDFVDKRGIKWMLEPMENLSMDIEEKQGLRRNGRRVIDVDLGRRRRSLEPDWIKYIPKEYRKYIPDRFLSTKGGMDMDYEVLFSYTVPPHLKETFESDWIDTAFKIIKEEGNTGITLRKVTSDNTRYIGYGRWDSVGDFLEHYYSNHVGVLFDRLAENDIRVLLTPVELVTCHKQE